MNFLRLALSDMDKVPYMLVVGEDEESKDAVSARKKGEGDLGSMSIADFVTKVNTEIAQMLS